MNTSTVSPGQTVIKSAAENPVRGRVVGRVDEDRVEVAWGDDIGQNHHTSVCFADELAVV